MASVLLSGNHDKLSTSIYPADDTYTNRFMRFLTSN